MVPGVCFPGNESATSKTRTPDDIVYIGCGSKSWLRSVAADPAETRKGVYLFVGM